ncbi:FAD binding domain-containing protein [Dactylonectria macrodidyma]|uniref:FAD binding domain-containing protein n=1 Tax=Dactylonectria macrodidyma TaxID=307937 RepID=A0A9P9ING1_9HYPO|nr:FAD binding domain-containing protein [Dactylonectria macrodidyma]
MSNIQVPVLIVGGGIVGLSASLFLSSYGIKSLLVERHAGTSIHPRARGVNRRTMELYRGIGIDEAIRAAGASLAPSFGMYQGSSLAEVVESHPRKVVAGPQKLPGAAFFDFGPVDGTRGTQDLIEPILLKAARDEGGDVRFNTECLTFDQGYNGVTATLLDRSSNAKSAVHASYMIAADGAASPIRQQLGVSTTGAGTLGYLLNILFEVDLSDWVRGREFSLCLVDRPEVKGLFASINNSDRWVFHLSYDPRKGEEIQHFPPERCRELIKIALGMPDVHIEIKSILPWEPTVRVAEKFQHGRVFLSGDAAHQMPPWGGQGANTGIADVHNLAWKLAAVLNGQATDTLLTTYDTERLPIGRLVSEESGAASDEHGLLSLKKSVAAILALVYKIPRLVGYGYRYDSRAICTSDTTPWFWRAMRLMPTPSRILQISGTAGTRAPHLWVHFETSRISTLDLLGKNFVIFAGEDGKEWCEAAPNVTSSLNVNLRAYCVGPSRELVAPRGYWESSAGITTTGAILVRPDGMVAWHSWSNPPNIQRKLQEVLKQVLCFGRPSRIESFESPLYNYIISLLYLVHKCYVNS